MEPKRSERRNFSAVFSQSLLGMNGDDYKSLKVLEQNKFLISKLSRFIANSNREFFYEKMKEKQNPLLLDYLYEENEDNEIEDEYGRVTYFFVKIGSMKIPIYQPGTIMFISGVDQDSDLVCVHDGCGQNGPILGMGCATFLTKFLCKLSKIYQESCINQGKNCQNYCPDVYKECLEELLEQHAKEDAHEHGRLIEMKSWLTRMIQEKPLKSTQESLFYLKDVAVYQNAAIDDINLEELELTREDLKQIDNFRNQKRVYQDTEMCFSKDEESYELTDELWASIKKGILTKNNIFRNVNTVRKQLLVYFSEMDLVFETLRTSEMMSGTSNTNHSRPESKTSSKTCLIRSLNYESKINEIEEKYQLKRNDKLLEYYCKLKQSFESLFNCSIIADAEVFELQGNALGGIFETLGDSIPEVGGVLTAAGIMISSFSKYQIESKLRKICELAVLHKRLGEVLARKMTIAKRDFLLYKSDIEMRMYLGQNFIKNLAKLFNRKKLTYHQSVAVKDFSIMESVLIALVESKIIIPSKEQDEFSIAEKAMRSYSDSCKETITDRKLDANEIPPEYERDVPFSIPEYYFESPEFPSFLKQVEGETSFAYQKRIQEYLEAIKERQALKMIDVIDPSDQQATAFINLLQNSLIAKKSKCEIF